MTVPDLIGNVLEQLRNGFYSELPRYRFNQDVNYLTAALGTYGYECDQRGWPFDVPFIYDELSKILRSFKHSGTEIKWMPNYLQHAIRQHIREHAEELSARAKSIQALVDKDLGLAIRKSKGRETKLAKVENPCGFSTVEVLATIHKDVIKMRRAAHAARRLKGAEEKRQGDLI